MILCDTNILIAVYRNNVEVISHLDHIGLENVAVSDVTCGELLYGARNKKELRIIRKDLNKLTILPIQTSVSAAAVQLIEKYSLSHKLSLPDALIAATAIFYKIPLFTLNKKDFKFIDGIMLD